MTNMTAKESSAAIAKAIAKVQQTYANLNGMVQDVALSIVNHALIHNDCTKAAALVTALPVKLQPLLQKWFMLVSPIGVRKDEDGNFIAKYIKKDSKAYNVFNLELAKTTNWWVAPAKPEVEVAPKTFLQIFEDIEKLLDRTTTDKGLDKFHEDDRPAIKAMAGALATLMAANMDAVIATGKAAVTAKPKSEAKSEAKTEVKMLPAPKAKAAPKAAIESFGIVK